MIGNDYELIKNRAGAPCRVDLVIYMRIRDIECLQDAPSLSTNNRECLSAQSVLKVFASKPLSVTHVARGLILKNV